MESNNNKDEKKEEVEMTKSPSASSLKSLEDKEKKETKKEEEKKPEEKPKISFGALFRFATNFDIFLMVIGGISALAVGAIMPAFSLIFGLIVDAFNEIKTQDEFLDKIAEVALYFVYVGIGAIGVNYFANAFFNWSSARQIERIRREYLGAIMRQEVGWFDKHQTGELITRISSDTIVIHEAMGDKFAQLLQFLSTCITGFVLGFIRGWKLSLVMLAVTPLIAISGGFIMKVMATLTTRGQAAYADAGAFATEIIAGIRTVASFAFEPTAVKKYSKSLVEAKKIGIKSGLTTGLGFGVTMFIFFGIYGLALWYGAQLVKNGEMTGGDVLTCFFSVLIGAFAIGQASPSMEALARGSGAAIKIYETIARETEIDSSSTAGKTLKKVKGNIEFRDVCFSYPTRPDIPLFRGLNLKIKKGEKVALVGHSGNGKSTIIQMILRFYDPAAGKVRIDRKDIRKLNLQWYRQQIGLVSQEPVLFTGTIADNIRYGKPDASDDEVMEAAKAANAHNFILDFPDQYHTQVGEKGAQLSGGQKQRIAIARAIIKNPKILLLDEATSALDSESEKVVQDALDSVMKGRTTIIVAHRLSTIRDADRIVVLSKGEVVEQGKHDDLMSKGGLYYELVKQQTGTEDKKERKKTVTSSKHTDVSLKEIKKSADVEVEEELKPVSFARLLSVNRPEFPLLIIGTLASAINGAIQPVFSIFFSEMVTLFYKPPAEIDANAWKWAVAFAAIGAGPLIFMSTSSGMFAVAGQNLIMRLRENLFKSILSKHVGWFDKKENNTGALTTRLASEATLVSQLVGSRLGLTAQNIATIICGLIIAFIYGWELTLLILGCSPFIGFANFIHMSKMKNDAEQQRKANESANQVATEAIMNIRTIFAFTFESKVYESYIAKMVEPTRMNIRSAHLKGFLTGIGQFLLFGSQALGFWFGGWLIVHRNYDFGQVLKVFMAIFMTAQGVGQTAAFAPDAAKANKAASVIFKVVDEQSEIDSFSEEGEKLDHDGLKGDIEFKEVSFTYPTRPDVPILKKMDLSIKSGQVVALVGPSGSGKSSIVSLIERFYDAQDGTVQIDGKDIKSLNLSSLRQNIGMVGQEPVLFTGSIADNIRYGKLDATDDEVIEAAKAANAHNFITGFTDQYNTQVGEKGAQLSGGQKQRIAIARAIIKNPKILLLDEATSALDAESEKVVQAALDAVMKGRTTVVVAHRLSTIKGADLICVIDRGVIAERGSHSELMDKHGVYYSLVERQTQ